MDVMAVQDVIESASLLGATGQEVLTINDSELVKLARSGDKNAYRALVEKYQRRVHARVYDIVRQHEDAEDIVQEAFVKAYFGLKNFRADSAFYTWIYRIAYNLAIDAKRRGRRSSAVVEVAPKAHNNGAESGAPEAASEVHGPLQVLQRKEQARRIGQELANLSAEHRAVITLRELEGLSYERIAEVVGVTVGTVMSRLHYARKKLQAALHDYAPAEAAKIVSEIE
jgi:RNA polymerase sigma-70 factor (ECF subfamily)